MLASDFVCGCEFGNMVAGENLNGVKVLKQMLQKELRPKFDT